MYNIHCIINKNGLVEFERLVLLAVCILEREAYGISVKREAQRYSKRTILLGSVHITLYRMQDKGILQSEVDGNTEKEVTGESDYLP